MSKLQKILVRARRQVFSEMVGNNPSIFVGEGYDFIELREYMAGDDIRHIDWNITAKMQKPFIKIFLLAFSTLKNGDLLSNYIFTDKMISHSKPSKKLHQIQKSVNEILEFDAINQQVDFKVIADTLYKRLRRKSLIIVIGDYFEIPDFRLLARKHEVVSVIVRDKLEENPPQMGFSSLVDPESGAVLEGDFNSSSVKDYAKKVQAHDHKLFDTLRRDQVRFTKVYTDSFASVELRRLFEAR